jgi:ribosomal protein S18 acetylase RimI-like enzyme
VAVSAELRGQGWGRRLIEAAEAVGVKRGCQYVWLDTYSFQARPFYEKLGYRVFGQLPDHPPGHTRFFMFKTLRNDAV